MQLKRNGNRLKLSATFHHLWNRISFSRLTILYFFFSISHFIIQFSFQIRAFAINSDTERFLSGIASQAQTTTDALPFLQGSTLRMCTWVSQDLNVNVASCPIVWNGGKSGGSNPSTSAFDLSSPPATPTQLASAAASYQSLASIPTPEISTFSTSLAVVPGEIETSSPTSSVAPHPTETITVFVHPQPSAGSGVSSISSRMPLERDFQNIHRRQSQGKAQSLTLNLGEETVTLNSSCLWTLNWSLSVVKNTKREDIVFVAFQFWVLGMSIVALLNESIPHIIASLVTHGMATAWAAFQISQTAGFRSDFNRVIVNGACGGVHLLPHYWTARSKAEIPSLVFNISALLVSCILTRKLIKLFGWQTFKRVGASLAINRIYMLVLTLSVTIQLSLFFIVATVALWIDQLMNSVIGDLVDFQTLYKVSSFITLALLIPWLMTGWFAVRRELRVAMFVFLMLSILYLGGWGVMFFSTTFRWTFTTWRFFSVMASASVALTFFSVILGVVCCYNFGKGLAHYFNPGRSSMADTEALGHAGFETEKVAFPRSEKLFSTYAYANFHNGFNGLGRNPSNAKGPLSSQQPGYFLVRIPPPSLQRNRDDVQRSNGYASSKSSGSFASNDSKASRHTQHTQDVGHVPPSKRWIIE